MPSATPTTKPKVKGKAGSTAAPNLDQVNQEAQALLAQGTGDQDPTAVAFGKYGGVPIPGARTLLGDQGAYTTGSQRNYRGWGSIIPSSATELTAQEVLDAFKGLSLDKLSNIQMQLYRAGGFYPAGSPPTSHLGVLTTDDIQAFQTALLGFVVNPQQTDEQGNKLGFNGYLQKLADKGEAAGVNLRNKAPNVIHLTNPDDLRVVLQKGAQELYGGTLPDEEVNRFVAAYQAQESATKTAAYNAGEGNLGTNGGSSTITDPASAKGAAETFIRTQHPNQVATTEFGSAMDNMLAELRRPG